MLEVRAIVLSTHGREAEITPLGGGCGHCSGENGCASGKLSKMFCGKQQRSFLVLNPVGGQVGDEVNVSMPEGSLLRSSWKMYVLPLLLMLACGLLGAATANDAVGRDVYAVLGAGLGLMMGFLWARLTAGSSEVQAVIQSVVSKTVRS